MNIELKIGELPRFTEKWDDISKKFGSIFQSAKILRVFELTWKGIIIPRHVLAIEKNDLVGFIPAYLYKSCPRVDYYRKATKEIFSEKLIMSHDLVGWYGKPVAINDKYRDILVKKLLDSSKKENAVTMFAGIDSRDKRTIHTLSKNGFELKQFHTLMTRDLSLLKNSDPTYHLPKKKRHRIRNVVSKAYRAGTSVRQMEENDYEKIVGMITGILEYRNTNPDVLPSIFVSKLIKSKHPGLDVLVAVDECNSPIGVQINFNWNSTYYIWLAGHYRELLKKYEQSHLLFESSIQRAIKLGCHEIQAGRNPYAPKYFHGFNSIPLLCAVKGSDLIQHQRAVQWITELEYRHFQKYGDQIITY